MTSIASSNVGSSTRSRGTREGGVNYTPSHVPIARGLNYGSARKREGGGMSNRFCGTGAGERHGMAAKSVQGLGRKVKPLKLQNGATVHIDLLCNRCGYENPHNHRRLRCNTCGVPLTQIHPDDAAAGKNTLNNYTSQAAFSPAASEKLERKNAQRAYVAEYAASVAESENSAFSYQQKRQHEQSQQLVVMAKTMNAGSTMRKKGLGGLGSRRTGLGPGARHGMSAGAVWHLPASTREIRLGSGEVITVDVICRKCGYEQPPSWRALRCQNCKEVLDQLGTLLTNHQFRAVGWHSSYKKKKNAERQRKKEKEKEKNKERIPRQYGTGHGIESQHVFGFSGRSIRSIVQRAAAQEGESSDTDSVRSERRRKKPSLSNLRSETNDVIGHWICAIDVVTGDDYFYNTKTKVVTWNCPSELQDAM